MKEIKENNKLQKILEKLRKLMDLKNSATECGETGEAAAAAAGITRLLKEYDLTLQDIPSELKPQDPVDVEEIDFHCSYMNYKWYWLMIDAIARFNNASTIRTQYKNTSGKIYHTIYKVVGRKKNREIVLYLTSFLSNQFLQIAKREYSSYKENCKNNGVDPIKIGEYMNSFLLGCVQGLREKLQAEQDSMSSEKMTALVKISRKEIDEFLRGMNVTHSRRRKSSVYGDVYGLGERTGREISINKGINGSKKETYALT